MRTQQSPTILLVLFMLLLLALLPLIYQQCTATFAHTHSAPPLHTQHASPYNQLNSCFLMVGNSAQSVQCMLISDCAVLTVTPYILAPAP